ncbi:hypothetical protein E0Z10_g5023 [Xylaria hypoxylon]|uniref:LysM domain-containing protein n=1 Tax=Xylaria hypoxylon TaxID=37992 RepID=A0A4Z0YHD6_9PEZI|nr:hypothetical protein E0Z10_g5023 [Xylaria hypoxylon]
MAQDTSSFTMFPIVGLQGLAEQLGWTQSCVTAMNATLTCDSDLYRMAGQIDNYFWSMENITSLCTSACVDDSSTWVGSVGDACGGQTFSVGGKLVPVDSVALRYVEGITMACLKSDDLPLVYTSDPLANEAALVQDDLSNPNSTSQTNATTGEPLYDPHVVAPPSNGEDNPYGPDNITDPAYYQEPTWCFLESQSWTGVDVEPPNCASDPTNTFCTDPSSMNRMANLYYDTTLCSPCFLTVMWYRINSLFLPDTDHSDYLIEQYQDILDVCQVSMPETIVRALPDYAMAPNITYLPPGTDPAGNSSTTTPGNCTGQTLPASSSGCDNLSQKYGVTTGDLVTATGSRTCTSTGSICVPQPCTLNRLSDGNSCDGLASAYTTSAMNITTNLFLSWNPNIMGLCDKLTSGQYVCSSPPGGAYTLLPPINGTNADTSGQVRGGQGPAGVVPTTNTTAAAPTQADIAENCTKFAYAGPGDTCFGFSQAFKISLADFTTWNPVLGYPDGHNCTTQFWLGYDYCIEVGGGSSSTTTTTELTTTKTTSLPFPTQSGIISTCNKFNNAVSGDFCTKFATDNGITPEQLYAWNSILGANGANCATQFQAMVDYCVGVSPTTTTTTTKATTTTSQTTSLPFPTQSGIISTCNKFKDAVSGDFCTKFAADNGITPAQLYAWNTILGADGANCATQFQAMVDYCVGVSTTTTSKGTTTTTTSKIPTQSGIAANCNKIVAAKSGEFCSVFAQNNKGRHRFHTLITNAVITYLDITTAQLVLYVGGVTSVGTTAKSAVRIRPSLDIVQRDRKEADFFYDGRNVQGLLVFHRGEGILDIRSLNP